MTQEIIGILGGMGPAATVNLFQKIINSTDAEVDQQHVELTIINDPHIPDRTKYILGKGENPIPRMIKNLNRLENAGATVAMIPCMTAHTFIDDLQNNISIPIINGIELIRLYLEKNPHINKVGLLATTGSIRSNVYKKYINNEIILPDDSDQKQLMQIIYGENGIKAGNTGESIIFELQTIVNKLRKEKNIHAIIAGCTELGLVMNNDNMSIPVIDPLLLLAKKAVELGSNP